jgi:hypothetical protein
MAMFRQLSHQQHETDEGTQAESHKKYPEDSRTPLLLQPSLGHSWRMASRPRAFGPLTIELGAKSHYESNRRPTDADNRNGE